ncbi:MAG: ATP-binding protein [Rhodospirillales bacterium]
MRISTGANIVAITLVILVGLMVAVQVYGVTTMRNIRAQEGLAIRISGAVLDLSTLVNEMQTRPNGRVFRQFADRVDSLDNLLVQLRATDAGQLPMVARMERNVDNIRNVSKNLANLMTDNGGEVEVPEALRYSFLSSSHALASLSNRLSSYEARELDSIESRVIVSTIGAAAVILLLIFACYALFVVGIMFPLVGFRDRVRQIAADEQIDDADIARSENELKEIANDFDRRYAAARAAQESLKVQAAELRRSNKDLEDFAYAASHDLRSPLRGIMTTAQWIADDLEKGFTPETKKNLELLQGRAARLDALLTGLLNYARATMASSDDATVTEFDSGGLFDEIIGLLDIPVGFKVQRTGTMPSVRAARVRLQQVMQNLIENAIKHHDREIGQVTVSARRDGEFVVFSIVDDGPGIDPKFHDKVVQIFETLKSRDVKETSGVGLAMVGKIVEQEGGRLEIDSPLTDRGCAMRVWWPAAPNTRAAVN